MRVGAVLSAELALRGLFFRAKALVAAIAVIAVWLRMRIRGARCCGGAEGRMLGDTRVRAYEDALTEGENTLHMKKECLSFIFDSKFIKPNLMKPYKNIYYIHQLFLFCFASNSLFNLLNLAFDLFSSFISKNSL